MNCISCGQLHFGSCPIGGVPQMSPLGLNFGPNIGVGPTYRDHLCEIADSLNAIVRSWRPGPLDSSFAERPDYVNQAEALLGRCTKLLEDRVRQYEPAKPAAPAAPAAP
jgi:hypothetical protein